MMLVRRRFLRLIASCIAVPSALRAAWAQTPQAAPKLTPILRVDLQGQEQRVQETTANVLDLAPGSGAPWHMHPAAQELLYVLAGDITVEIEGQGTKLVKTGEIVAIPAEIPHLARNESASTSAKALVVHSRADKDKPFVVAVKRST